MRPWLARVKRLASIKAGLRVLILGSCVTGDALEYQDEPCQIVLAGYFARSPLSSAMHETVFDGVDTSTIPSEFQARMVQQDLTGAARKAVADGDWDLTVLDLIDNRFDVIENETGARATRSNELLASGYNTSSDRVVAWGSQESFDWWLWGWRKLLRLVDGMGRRNDLRLNRVWWSSDTIDGEEPETPFTFDLHQVEAENARLAECYRHIE